MQVMASLKQKQKTRKPPRLLRWFFTSIVAICAAILLAAWSIINHQVEQLVASRTSEYAHSIAKIAANSSATALMSEDTLALKILVENVAKDPYIKSATIYSDDGQIVTQSPEMAIPSKKTAKAQSPEKHQPVEVSATPGDNSANRINVKNHQLTGSTVKPSADAQTLSPQMQAYLQAQRDTPFIEKIIYQDVAAGWFKVTIDREKLETSFRSSLIAAERVIIFITLILLVVLLLTVIHFEKRIKSLVSLMHRMLQSNTPELPSGRKQWIEAAGAMVQAQIQKQSQDRLQNQTNTQRLPDDSGFWFNSTSKDNTLFCYCQFSLGELDDEQTAYNLSTADSYLREAIAVFGVQSQGDLLSGCLIPFPENKDQQEALVEALSLVQLIKILFANLSFPIKVRAFIGTARVYFLENEHGEISGICLPQQKLEKINRLAASFDFDRVIFLSFEQQALSELGKFKQRQIDGIGTCLQLTSINDTIEQQVSRQANFISTNNCVE